ncbi:Tyrosine-protein kinase etk [Tatumella ptyseos]|uniref:Tyrosine-protein kinase etk n=1 Tax=Tatumella ptyseos TaxID=82987 RepID=A0A2X5R1Q0_9GAMM|nr:Tyrosine-protein kinase etk [Tatumella ptyseos]
MAQQKGKVPTLTLTAEENGNYRLTGGGYNLQGHIGQLLEAKGLSLLINDLQAAPGTEFTVNYISWLDAINNLQQSFSAADQGKDTGMLNLTLTGSDPELIQKTLRSISDNYLAQNIDLQAAQDSKSLQFLDQELPQVRAQLDSAEDKLSAYRKRSDSVDLNLQAARRWTR